MTTAAGTPFGTPYPEALRDHLWMHFTRHGPLERGAEVPLIVRGEGHHVLTLIHI